MPDYQDIHYEVVDPVATITLARPEAMNGWTPLMALEVRHAVHSAANDPAVVGIIITGEGRAFCAGADMNNLQGITEGGGFAADGEAARALGSPTPTPRPTPISTAPTRTCWRARSR